METRLKQLDQLHSFVEGVDKDVTLILQNLQWDRKHLLSNLPMVTCRYDNNHQLPQEKRESHETKCFMKLQGYSEDEEMLPEPLDINANTLVKLSTQQIITILNEASKCNPMFKRGNNWESRWSEPCSLARLQVTYTGDERRALHDAVVQAVPSCHDLADLALPGCSTDEGVNKVKSRVEILAELRDMRRRRTKYRQAAKTRNYSDVLRDVIKTQMESYSGTSQFTEQSKENNSIRSDNKCSQNDNSNQLSTRDRKTYIATKDIRGGHLNKYYKSPNREANRYNSATNTNYNSKRHQISGSERQQTERYHSYRDNYKINESTREKAFEYNSRDKRTSSSHQRYEHKQYHSKDRSERNIKETQIRNSYSQKRIREYTSDESEDSRTTDREYRRKSHRNRRSPSYNDNYRSRVDRTHIKTERLKSPTRFRPGGSQPLPAQTHNKSSEFHTSIKQERVNSPDTTKKQDYGKISRPLNGTDSGTSALIKVEKAETVSQYSCSRSENRSSDYKEDKSRESNVTMKRANVQNKDKITENRQEKSGYYDSPSTNRNFESSSRKVVYFERSSERQHRCRDSSNYNREYDVTVKEEYTETNNGNDRNIKLNRGLEKISDRHCHHRRRSASSDTEECGHDRRHDKYHFEESNSNDIGKDNRTGDSNRYNKPSYCDKHNTRCDVTDEETNDERRKRKKYS